MSFAPMLATSYSYEIFAVAERMEAPLEDFSVVCGTRALWRKVDGDAMLDPCQASAIGRCDGTDADPAEVRSRDPGGLRQRHRPAGGVGRATHGRSAANYNAHADHYNGGFTDTDYHYYVLTHSDYYLDNDFDCSYHYDNVLAVSRYQLPQPGPHLQTRRSIQGWRILGRIPSAHAGRQVPLRVPNPKERRLLRRPPQRRVLAVGVQGARLAISVPTACAGALAERRLFQRRGGARSAKTCKPPTGEPPWGCARPRWTRSNCERSLIPGRPSPFGHEPTLAPRLPPAPRHQGSGLRLFSPQ